jgi:hypothetical protein
MAPCEYQYPYFFLKGFTMVDIQYLRFSRPVSVKNVLFGFSIIGILVGAAHAQINIKGTVFDSKNAPISGVAVLLKANNISATSNADGRFSLVAVPIRAPSVSLPTTSNAIFANGRITLSLAQRRDVRLDAYSAAGARIVSIVPGQLNAGVYVFDPFIANLGSGIVLIRLKYGSATNVFRSIAIDRNRCASVKNKTLQESQALGKTLVAAVDSLIFSKAGLAQVSIPLKSLVDTSIEIVMESAVSARLIRAVAAGGLWFDTATWVGRDSLCQCQPVGRYRVLSQ